MSTPAPANTALTTLEAHLRNERKRPDFDMFDAPELPVLAPFPLLHDAVEWLGVHVTPAWREADTEAQRHQWWHNLLARTAVGTGVAAIVFAILQLVLLQCSTGITGLAAVLEGLSAAAAIVAVVGGIFAKFNRNWLGYRHRAERLRMLKFRALARPELWRGDRAAWEKWVLSERDALPPPQDIRTLRSWSSDDAPEAEPGTLGELPTAAPLHQALKHCYLRKRIFNQGDYFKRKGGQAGNHWTVRWRHQRLPLFVVTMGCIRFQPLRESLGGFSLAGVEVEAA